MKKYDNEFLIALDTQQIRQHYAKITVLDFFTEKALEEISGKISSGNISGNGSSSVRRTASLSFVVDNDDFNLFEVNNLLSINKKIKLEIGISNNTGMYTEEETIWFPQGIFIITSPSISYSTSGLNISLQLKDKMCLLNGDCGGLLPASVNFAEIEGTTPDGNIEIKKPLIYDIILELVHHFGNEPLYKIAIDGIPSKISQCMTWVGSAPIYAYRTDKPNPNSNNVHWNLTMSEAEAKKDPNYRTFYYGSELAYAPIPFTYPGELIGDQGATVVSILDKIKNKLGNFEYFYDVEGIFHFQEIKNYTNTTESTTILRELNDNLSEPYIINAAKGQPIYNFENSPIVLSYNLSPQYTNVKNDYLIWGMRKTPSGKDYPIRYHLAIDKKPSVENIEYNNLVLFKYTDEYEETYTYLKVPRIVESKDNQEKDNMILYKTMNDDKYWYWNTYKSEWVDVTNNVTPIESYKPKDWRTVLYLQGEEALTEGRESNYYYTELKNEWPRIYDLENQCFYASCIEDPASMNYYLDFIDVDSPIGALSVDNIGRRCKVITGKDINCMFEPTPIDTVLIRINDPEAQEIIKECNEIGKTWMQVDPAIYDSLAVGKVYVSAFEEIRGNLYSYTSYNENISISCLPIFYLEPNTRAHLIDKKCGINGNYLIKSFNLPLGNGTMSLQCTKIVDKL